jgi:hypothetical protein
MFKLKPLQEQNIPSALEKAKHYRLLNEPLPAESICLDILEVDPDNQEALVTLLLSLSDQFEQRLNERYRRACALLDGLEDDYERAYYDGLIAERRAKVHLKRGGPGSGPVTYDWFRQAMERYEKAEGLSPADNDDAVLRWNTCARILMSHPEIKPETEHRSPQFLE